MGPESSNRGGPLPSRRCLPTYTPHVSLGDCPYVALPGARPPVLAGRADVLAAVATQRDALAAAKAAYPVALTGRYGSGRTAAGDEIARAAARAGWAPAVIAIEPSTIVVHEIARGVAAMVLRRLAVEATDRAASALLATTRSFATAHHLELPLDVPPAVSPKWTGDVAADLEALFRQVGEAGAKAHRGYLLVIDDSDLAPGNGCAAAAAAASCVARAGLPLLTVFTGLPGTASMLGAALRDVAIRSLSPAEVNEAVAGPAHKLGVDVPPATIASIGRRSGGHPYFVQALARAAWEAADASPITAADVETGSLAAERELMTHFFGPVLDGLSSGERRFLRSMAEVEHPTFEAISRLLGDANRFDPSSSQLAGVRDSLLERRVVFEANGALEYALPFFDRYVTATR